MPLLTEKQIRAKYKGKYIDIYPHHLHHKDKNNQWVTMWEVRGVSSTIKENYQDVEEALS